VADDVARVDFRADMINAPTNQQFAAVSIPFVTQG